MTDQLDALLIRWRDAALDGDVSAIADLIDETNAALASEPTTDSRPSEGRQLRWNEPHPLASMWAAAPSRPSEGLDGRNRDVPVAASGCIGCRMVSRGRFPYFDPDCPIHGSAALAARLHERTEPQEPTP